MPDKKHKTLSYVWQEMSFLRNGNNGMENLCWEWTCGLCEWLFLTKNRSVSDRGDRCRITPNQASDVLTDYMKTTASSPFRGERVYELPPIPDRGQSIFTRKPERKWRSMKNRTKTRHRTFRTVEDYFHRQLWGRPKTNYRNTDRNVRCDTYNVVCFRRINLLYWPAKRNQIEI